RDLVPLFFQALATVEHRLVLSHRSHHVISLVSVLSGNALYCQVVALCCPDEVGNSAATVLDRLICSPPKFVVTAGSIAKALCEKGQHLLQHARINWRGGMVVHVDGQLHGRLGWSSHHNFPEAALLV